MLIKNKYFPLVIVTIAEALIGIFVKLSEGIPIFTLNFYRVLFAFVFLLATIPFIEKDFWKIKKKEMKAVLIIGALIALQISLFNIAMRLAPIANVVILWSVYPFFVFIISAIFLDEKLRKIHIVTFVLAITGIFLAKPFSSGYVLGNVISLFGGIVYAVLISYMRFEHRTESSSNVIWFMAFASLFLFPAIVIFGPGDLLHATTHSLSFISLKIKIPVLIWAVSLGVISTGLTYLFMTFALQKIKANIYSLVDIIFSPIMAAFFGLVLLGEIPNTRMIYGGAVLLLSGFWLSTALSIGSIAGLDHFFEYFDEIKQKLKEWY